MVRVIALDNVFVLVFKFDLVVIHQGQIPLFDLQNCPFEPELSDEKEVVLIAWVLDQKLRDLNVLRRAQLISKSCMLNRVGYLKICGSYS